ncbi:MAG: flagellar export protein FliJ [Pseudomonadota bacterium]
MAFKFRYEAVLAYRGHTREKAEIALAGAQEKLRKALELLNHYERSLQQARRSLEISVASGMASGELRSRSEYITGLGKKIEGQIRHVAVCEKAVGEKTDELLAKTKEYKVIEKLREKDFQKWKHQQHRQEQKWMDEVGVTRHGRAYF